MKKLCYVFFAAMLIMAGCGKDEKQGCMNPEAPNYDPEAVEDCCCNFTGRSIFYFGQAKSNALVANQSTELHFYVGEKERPTEKVGVFPASKYWNGVPPCGQEGTITIQKDLGTAKTKKYYYLVVDQLGRDIWKGQHEWKATSGSVCTPVELK